MKQKTKTFIYQLIGFSLLMSGFLVYHENYDNYKDIQKVFNFLFFIGLPFFITFIIPTILKYKGGTMKENLWKKTANLLVVVGAINWGLTALNLNIVSMLGNIIGQTWVEPVVYLAVGVAGITELIYMFKKK